MLVKMLIVTFLQDMDFRLLFDFTKQLKLYLVWCKTIFQRACINSETSVNETLYLKCV